MIYFLTRQPLWLSGMLLVGLTTALAMIGPRLVRRYVTLEKLTTNNEVAGFKFATVGVLYAVLLAFAIIVVWEKFNDAENHVAQEAGAAATIYRLSQGIGEQPGAALRAALTTYLKTSRMTGPPWNTAAKVVPLGRRSIQSIEHCRHSIPQSEAIPLWCRKFCVNSTSSRRCVARDLSRRKALYRASYGRSCSEEPP
jgi:hypothetical protein